MWKKYVQSQRQEWLLKYEAALVDEMNHTTIDVIKKEKEKVDFDEENIFVEVEVYEFNVNTKTKNFILRVEWVTWYECNFYIKEKPLEENDEDIAAFFIERLYEYINEKKEIRHLAV